MSAWNRRKKYSIEGDVSNGTQPKVKLQLNKLVKRELYLTMLSIAAVTTIIIGSTYAVFSSVNKSKDYNVINVGTLEISYEDTGNGLGDIINLNNAFPILDSEGMKTTGYKFKITNTGSLDSNYSVRIADDQAMIDADGCAENLLPKTALKYSLNSGGATLLSSKTNYVIDSGTIGAGKTKTYDLKMWIKSDAGNEILGKHFHGKIIIDAEATEIEPTPEQCFDFEESTGTIAIYKCGTRIWNGNSVEDATSELLPEGIDEPILDVVIPKTINGVAVTNIEATSANASQGIYPFTFRGQGIGITSVVIPEGVKTIGSYAFQSNQLTSVTIPNGVTTIKDAAFNVNQLTNVVIPNSVTTIGTAAFQGNRLTNIVMPNSVTSLANQAFNGNQLPDNQAFIYRRNSDGTEDKTTIISYGGANRNNVMIPEGVKTIGSNAFAGNQLTSVTIPSSVTSIENGAFQGNHFTSVTIPSSVTSIGSVAFSYNQLTSVIIKGKSSSANFTSYPSSSPFGWASGYSDDNITWNG